MAFKDITKVFYDGKVKIDYKDKAHAYYARTRKDFDLPEDDKKAWNNATRPKGTTGLIEDTLEKKGLMQWPKQVALRELFGFYGDFTGDNGQIVPAGFSKGIGTMWETIDQEELKDMTREELLAALVSANDGWKRKQKKGADIGSVVHDAIEHFIKGEDFDIAEAYMWGIKDAYPIPEADSGEPDLWLAERTLALEDFTVDTEMAKTAFLQFVKWWTATKPVLYGAEDLLYSMEYDVCGTFDGDIGVHRQFHPVFKDDPSKPDIIRCTADWKTSNASKSPAAAMPEGVNYQYYVQSAIYEMIRREMGLEPADDLLIVSARKDGGFTLIYASELGLSVEDCIAWARSVITCFKLAKQTKEGLLAHVEVPEKVVAAPKKAVKKNAKLIEEEF